MYIILRGSCNVHVDPDFDETAQAGALQKASLQPKVAKKKQPSAAKHVLRPSVAHLEHLSSTLSTRSDVSLSETLKRRGGSQDGAHPRKPGKLLVIHSLRGASSTAVCVGSHVTKLPRDSRPQNIIAWK